MDHDPPPDAYEKGIRFGCGAIFGGILWLLVLVRIIGNGHHSIWLWAGLSALMTGLLAMRFGDQLYSGAARLFQALFWWW